ncbi:MAG: glycosyltransferase involved in cell wall biosynthesis [Gammaproteobacteria bacterium]|jgi:glycosyltransferase involved in cell wall biosynthesis
MKIAFLGTVGLPAHYGGFETLVDNLVNYHSRTGNSHGLTVWCSSKEENGLPANYKSADLRYIGLKANGVQSIPYDVLSLLDAIRTKHDRIVLLGVSGAMALPLLRLFSKARFVTNIDGIEWKREKWNGLARTFLRASEWAAVRFSHEVIADNQGIADHVRDAYGANCHVIAYGGDHAVAYAGQGKAPEGLPKAYALALCRIEPENNVHIILEAFSSLDTPLVFVGNWGNSAYGQKLKAQYATGSNLYLLDPIYDPGVLYALRDRASVYVHGHSAGGTNPSLVEMMHFGVPVLAHGCNFNRYSTEDRARYFKTANELAKLVWQVTSDDATQIGNAMQEIARRRYTWDHIGEAYFALLEDRQKN